MPPCPILGRVTGHLATYFEAVATRLGRDTRGKMCGIKTDHNYPSEVNAQECSAWDATHVRVHGVARRARARARDSVFRVFCPFS